MPEFAFQSSHGRPRRAVRRERCGGGARFTLVELLVVIAIIAALAAILLPVLRNARAAGKVASCLGQHRQVVLAAFNWSGDHGGFIPDDLDLAYRNDAGMTWTAQPCGPDCGDMDYNSHPRMLLQHTGSYTENGVSKPYWQLGVGILYREYLPDGRLYYCTDQVLYHREFSLSYEPRSWKNPALGFTNRDGTVRMLTTAPYVIESSIYYNYFRNPAARRPRQWTSLGSPANTMMRVDRVTWDDDSEHSGMMKFSHADRGSVRSFYDGSAQLLVKRRTSGFSAPFAAWVSYGVYGGAWGVDKGYWPGTKCVDPDELGPGYFWSWSNSPR